MTCHAKDLNELVYCAATESRGKQPKRHAQRHRQEQCVRQASLPV